MRSVFLSQFIEKPVFQGTHLPSLPSTPSFSRVLEKLQKTNQSTPLSRVLPGNSSTNRQLNSTISQRLSSMPQSSSLRGRVQSFLPRTLSDPRFLTPPSTTLKRSQPLPRTAVPSQAQELQTAAGASSSFTVPTYGSLITATARQLEVDPALSLAVARAESGMRVTEDQEVVLNPRAVSPSGAVGLFQLMEATGKEQLRTVAPQQTYNPLNPHQNIRLGVNYLKEMSETFSENTVLRNNLSTVAGANAQEVRHLATAAYNAGPGRVARAQELARAHGQDPAYYRNVERYLSQETQLYVKKVERFTAEFRGDEPSSRYALAQTASKERS